MDSNTLLNAGPVGNLDVEKRLQGMTEQLRARLAQRQQEEAKPLPGVGFGPDQLGQVIAEQVKLALDLPDSLTRGGYLSIQVPAGSDLTPLFNNPTGGLVILLRQYTPGPAGLLTEPTAPDSGTPFKVPEL